MTIPALTNLTGTYGGDVCPGIAGGDWTLSALCQLANLQDGETTALLTRASGNTGYTISATRHATDGSITISAALGTTGQIDTITSEPIAGWVGKWMLVTLVAEPGDARLHVNGAVAAFGSLTADYAPAAGENMTVGGTNGTYFGGVAYDLSSLSVSTVGTNAFHLQNGSRLEVIDTALGTIPTVGPTYYDFCWDGYSAREGGIEAITPGVINQVSDTWAPTPNGGSVSLTRLSGAALVRWQHFRENWLQLTAPPAA
jgi:hypothetical protein